MTARFEERVRDALAMRSKKASDEEIIEKHGRIVLRTAVERLFPNKKGTATCNVTTEKRKRSKTSASAKQSDGVLSAAL